MSNTPQSTNPNPALQALIRAGERARQLAAQTHTAVIYQRGGELVREYVLPATAQVVTPGK